MKTITRIAYVLLGLLALGCFALAPLAQAVVPPPDGGYPNANTAEGEDALFSLTTGFGNTAVGFEALFSNETGSANTATGVHALELNETGNDNTATGVNALQGNTTGSSNTANGVFALLLNNGDDNTAIGGQALISNRTGSRNTANGAFALSHNTTGEVNTATGAQALLFNATGRGNVADGAAALFNNTGSENTATGFQALQNNTSGNNNIALGNAAGANRTTGNNNIDIGNRGVEGESNSIRIGTPGTQTAAFIAGISGTAIGGGVAVRVSASGQLGTAPSSVRFKQNIQPIDKASEAIFALKPVTFLYKKEIDPERIQQFGLVAEEVEKVNPDLVVRDPDGKPYTVRYDAVNAMLLNEFLKEHRTVQELEANATNQQKEIKILTAALKEQASQIQKVSAQIELSKFANGRIRRGGPAPQTVLNNQ
jgi:hypothetical protein